jgi:hypothetical protein
MVVAPKHPRARGLVLVDPHDAVAQVVVAAESAEPAESLDPTKNPAATTTASRAEAPNRLSGAQASWAHRASEPCSAPAQE